jgi:glutaryl-CoA dehydrogenase
MTGATVTREVGEALATDYFLVRDQLTDEQYGRFIEMRRFVDREVLPVIAGHWERAEFPWALV